MKKRHKIMIGVGVLIVGWLVYEYIQAKARQEALQEFVMATITDQRQSQDKRREAFDKDFKKAWSRFDRPSQGGR